MNNPNQPSQSPSQKQGTKKNETIQTAEQAKGHAKNVQRQQSQDTGAGATQQQGGTSSKPGHKPPQTGGFQGPGQK